MQHAKAFGTEIRTKGVQVILGPVVGPVGRVVLGGRNWEGRLVRHAIYNTFS